MPSTGTRRLGFGLVLIAVCWPLNWGLAGLRTHLLFFPLWLGYVLVLDGLTQRRTGTSILRRAGRGGVGLFLLSIPLWWAFEWMNERLQNWEYVGREAFGDVEYALLCSLAFSTVVPAILVSAEFARSFRVLERCAHGPVLRPTPRLLMGCVLTGLAMFAAMWTWPGIFFPFAWTSGVFLLDPLVHRLRGRGFLVDLARGDWRPWMSVWAGSLLCGFFWEMWNIASYPKWIYHVPGVDFLRIFEMPLLGYLGYLPFAMQVYLIHQLVMPGASDPRLGAKS